MRVAIIIVGKRQPKSKRHVCVKCGALLEYLDSDVRIEPLEYRDSDVRTEESAPPSFRFLDCPSRGCRHANFLGTGTHK